VVVADAIRADDRGDLRPVVDRVQKRRRAERRDNRPGRKRDHGGVGQAAGAALCAF